MIKRYIIRYVVDCFIKTLEVKTEEEKDDIISMLNKLGYEYVVIASKDNKESNFHIGCMLQFEEFKTNKKYY